MNDQRIVALCRCTDAIDPRSRRFHAPTGVRLSDRRTAAVSVPIEHSGSGPVDVPVRNVDSILRGLDFEVTCEGPACTSEQPRAVALVRAKTCLRPLDVCDRCVEHLMLCQECTEHYTKRGGVCGACGARMPARSFKVVRWL